MLRNLEILFFVLFVFLYFYLFSNGALKKITYTGLLFYQDIENPNSYYKKKNIYKEKSKFKNLFHLSKNKLVYFDKNYNIFHSIILTKQMIATASSRNYILYQKVGDSFSFYNRKGEKYWEMKNKSYPYLSRNGDRIVFISTDNSFFSIYDGDMNVILKDISYGPMITDFQFCNYENSFLVSYSNGEVIYFNSNGEIIFKKNFNKDYPSEYNYIKSTSISKTGLYVGVIANLYPERLMVFDRSGNVLNNIETDFNRRKRSNFFIDEKNKLVVDFHGNKVYINSLTKNETIKELIFQKNIKEILIDSLEKYLFLLINFEYGESQLYFFNVNKKIDIIDSINFINKNNEWYYLEVKNSSDTKKYLILQNKTKSYLLYLKN